MPDEKGGVEELRDKLYSRANNEGVRPRAHLSAAEDEAPLAWSDSRPEVQGQNYQQFAEPPRRGFSVAAKFLMGSAAFFVLAALAAGYFFFGGNNYISTRNIDLQIVTPSLVDGGSASEVEFIIANRNSSQLQLADLVIEYPEGTRNPDDLTQALPRERISIGTIAPGQQVKRTAKAVFYGQEGTLAVIKASLEYSVPGSNAVFVKSSESSFTIGSSPVSVSVDMPNEAVTGQAFEMVVTVQSNATVPVENVVVEGQYPFGYSVLSATPASDYGQGLWRLGTMAPGTTKVIRVTGTIDGADGDERIFRFLAGSQSDPTDVRVQVPFLSIPATLTVHRPFISGSISIGGQTGSSIPAQAGQTVQGVITWRNNLTTEVSDVQVKLTLSGPVLDRGTISGGNGFYQSSDNSITWTSAEDPSLASVPPGGSGTLQFSFATLQPGSGGTVYANPTVAMNLSVRGVRPGQSGVPEAISSVATAQVTLASALSLAVQSLHYSGPLPNSGPIPPVAEQRTTYTVRWTVRNPSNTIANTTVSTVLPSYVDFVAAGASPGVTYEAGSRTVRWNIGELRPGVGYNLGAEQAAFQVALNASASQASQAPALTGASRLQGTDRFAQVQVSATAEAITTRTSDPQFTGGMDIVQPAQ